MDFVSFVILNAVKNLLFSDLPDLNTHRATTIVTVWAAPLRYNTLLYSFFFRLYEKILFYTSGSLLRPIVVLPSTLVRLFFGISATL